jgi:hypothetical protein
VTQPQTLGNLFESSGSREENKNTGFIRTTGFLTSNPAAASSQALRSPDAWLRKWVADYETKV